MIIPKDCFNFIIKKFSAVSHVEDLQCLFDGDSALESLVIHEKLHEVEELPGLKACFIGNAALVHRLELLLADEPVEVIVHFLPIGYKINLPR